METAYLPICLSSSLSSIFFSAAICKHFLVLVLFQAEEQGDHLKRICTNLWGLLHSDFPKLFHSNY